jgi:photosystem II stability/assembly factor-like uncharacterized protein
MDNYGLTFTGPSVPIDIGYEIGPIYGLGRLPAAPATLFACTAIWSAGFVLRSEDGGGTWEAVYTFNENGASSGLDLVVTPVGEVFVGYGAPGYPDANHGILRSGDGGDTWEEIAGSMPRAGAIAGVEVDPADSQHLYARQGGYWEQEGPVLGVYETLDGGEHWTQVLQGNCMDLSMHPDDAQILVAIVSGEPEWVIWLSRDGGESWENVMGNLPGAGDQCAISPMDERIYLAGGYGVWATSLYPTAVEATPAIGRGPCAHPNPFNPATSLSFSLRQSASVSLEILDPQGRHLRHLLAGEVRPAGTQSVAWDGRDDRGQALASGVYLARLIAGNERAAGKLLLLK